MPLYSPANTIEKKKQGKTLTEAEINAFVQGLMNGQFTDYQASALLMAICFQGMNFDETAALTQAMLKSGERYDLSEIEGYKADKHSTGGVGDKVSLILAPLAASCGLKVPMMAGRGLGHTGGTLDKLEAIDGFKVQLTREKFYSTLSQVGCAIIGQSEKIAPADRKLYALRDVTATVDSIPLITASILSKKIAEGTQGLVMDVKVGNGAFMKTKEKAKKLAQTIIRVGKRTGLKCRAMISSMDQPLGYACGNSLEVIECIEILRNQPHPLSLDLKELTVQLCAHMLEISGLTKNLTEARKLTLARLKDGSAYEYFKKMVAAQGGNIEWTENTQHFPSAPHFIPWKAKRKGYITHIDTEMIGKIVLAMGGGRLKASDPVDHRVGLVFLNKLGSKVESGEPIAIAHLASLSRQAELENLFQSAITIAASRKPAPKLIQEVLQ